MNTSKSLADIRTKVLVHGYGTEPVIYEIGLDAEAKQAIVEAVEGIYGDSDGLREFAGLNLIKSVPEVPSKREERNE